MAIEPLSRGMAIKIVNKFIGVNSGDLFGFSFRTLWEFYPEYCDFDIAPRNDCGTKRDCFTKILLDAAPKDQAKILSGLLKKCPVGQEQSPETRTQEFAEEILSEIRRLQGVSPVDAGNLAITAEVVERAISEAKILIKEADATSAVDRVHMALHGYVKWVCSRSGIRLAHDPSMTLAFSTLRTQHPSFRLVGPHSAELRNILQLTCPLQTSPASM